MRNKEIGIFLGISLLLCFPFLFYISLISWDALFLSVFLVFCLMSSFLVFTQYRYRRLRQLNDAMRRIREGDNTLNLETYEEGELSILNSEIYKVTVQLREKAEALQENQKFLSTSLSDISHQLKTPLTSMTMMIDLLQDVELNSDKQKEFTQLVSQQLTRMSWLTQALLKMAKLEGHAVDFAILPVSLHSLLMKSLSQLEVEMMKQQIEWQLDCPDHFMMNLDESWMAEALSNILRNCTQHTPQGGQIRISCTNNPLLQQIVIEDTGEGIDSQDLPHLFERFYKGKNSKADSVGIGLAMSKQIIEAQGGSIVVESHLHQGSRFIIRFAQQVI